MSAVAMRDMWKRQSGTGVNGDTSVEDYDPDDGDWWWSTTGMAVRYSIVTAIFILVLLYFVGGYIHAQRRLRKNLAPLSYHRWMVQRRHGFARNTNYAYDPAGNPPPGHMRPLRQGGGQAYDMDVYGYNASAPMPPPAYNNEHAPPPAYQPPQGGSKVLADQADTANLVRSPQPAVMGASSGARAEEPR